LNAVARKVLVIRRVLSTYGDAPLRDYVAGLLRFSDRSWQDRAELFDVLRHYVTPLLGEAVADDVANDLARTPIALTANHHGVDFFAQSVQSSLLFSLRESGMAGAARTIPVFACGTVPLNNTTFPRGLLLYGTGQQSRDVATKLPIFSDRYKRDLVSTARAFDAGMLERAESRVERLLGGEEQTSALKEATSGILATDFAHPEVLARSTYSDQAVTLNHLIWKRLFQNPDDAKGLVYLELEKIAARLLCLDLMNSDSLAFRVFFDDKLRDMILQTLDGRRACWDLAALRKRMQGVTQSSTGAPSNRTCGTVFFWGVDERKRRVPLVLDGSKDLALVGVGERGERISISFCSDALCAGLSDGTLLPALFSSYLAIPLARGVTCLGGYYQAGYLPIMQSAVVGALQRTDPHSAVAEHVARVPTNAYLSGMQAVMTTVRAKALTPAGILEIVAGGGLSSGDLERIGAISVRSAHLASIVETVLDVMPELADSDEWSDPVETELYRAIRTQMIVK
jgi:hypothetical protein